MLSVKPNFHPIPHSVSLAILSTLIAACGGGSSSSTPTGGASATTNLIVEGSAATGAALPNAAVSIKCATGTGSTTTSTSGRYSVPIPGGALPCVIQVISTDGQLKLHSAIEGTGSGTVTANVTPLSELVVAQAQGAQASDLFDQFDANKGKLTTAILDDAKAKVRAALVSILDLTGTDPIKDPLVAANGTTTGNALDQKLDALNAKLLASQVKIQELSAVLLANANGSTPEVVRSFVQPANAGCSGLKTGTYRLINPMAPSVEEVSIDATKLTATSGNGTESLGSVSSCSFTTASGSKVSLGLQGVGLVRTTQGNDFSFMIPKQDLALADLAGTWGYVSRYQSSTTTSYEVEWGEIALDSTGKMIAAKFCNASRCNTGDLTDAPQGTKASDGSFNFSSAKRTQPGYAFRSASGAMIMIISKPPGSPTKGEFIVLRKGEPVSLPTVGEVYGRNELLFSSANILDSAFTAMEFTTTAVNATTRSHTRKRTSDCRVDVIVPSPDFSNLYSRDAGTSPNCAGTGTISFPAIHGTQNRGIGLSAFAVPASNMIGFSVEK